MKIGKSLRAVGIFLVAFPFEAFLRGGSTLSIRCDKRTPNEVLKIQTYTHTYIQNMWHSAHERMRNESAGNSTERKLYPIPLLCIAHWIRLCIVCMSVWRKVASLYAIGCECVVNANTIIAFAFFPVSLANIDRKLDKFNIQNDNCLQVFCHVHSLLSPTPFARPLTCLSNENSMKSRCTLVLHSSDFQR